MSLEAKFCSECGTPLEAGALFCAECGAKVVALEEVKKKDRPRKKSPQSFPSPEIDSKSTSKAFRPKKPTSQTIIRDTLWSANSLSSGFQWAIIWAVGWLPLGILMSKFYDTKHALNPEFYAAYPRQWWSTLSGLTITFTMGALIGGFVAGLLLYRLLNIKKFSLGIGGVVPTFAWALFWVALLGILTVDIQGIGMDDGTIFISIYILGPIFAAALSFYVIKFFKKTYDLEVTTKQRSLAAVYWALCTGLSLLLMSMLVELITEFL